MRLAQAGLVARHDLGLLRRRRGLMASLVAFAIAVSVGFPLIMRYAILQRASVPAALLPSLLDSFGFWYVIGAATLPIGIASYSIVGEKLERSLEPLLATPTTDGEILLGKALAAFLPTIAALWAGSLLFMTLMDRVTSARLGYLYYPNWAMGEVLFLLAPLACLFAVEASILISSRVSDVRTAQQFAGLLFVPFLVLYLASELRLLVLDSTNLLYVSGALAAVTLGLFFLTRATFDRDEILTRWR